ncbi:MAG TPA: ADOP family duplicated permease [Terriglobales bacterium]|nr:ADOP family duplicated permease [Terriglobales bacterium]
MPEPPLQGPAGRAPDAEPRLQDWLAAARAHLAGAALPPARRQTAEEELAQHLEACYQAQRAAGAAEAEARAAALAELSAPPGGPSRQAWRPGPPLLRDIRDALRSLRHAPGFTLAAVLCLGLAIGANAAIFALADVLLLRPLPVPNPGQLAQVEIADHHGGGGRAPYGAVNYALYQHIAAAQEAFTDLAAWAGSAGGPLDAATTGKARLVQQIWVTGNFFSVLGVQAAAGRLLAPADDQPGCGAPGVVLSYSYWRRALDGVPIAGTFITLNRHALPILGVTPKGFRGVDVGGSFDVALPLCAEPLLDGDGAWLHAPYAWLLDPIGRLRPGWDLERASAQLAAISPAMFAATVPSDYGPRARSHYLKRRLEVFSAARGVSSLGGRYASPLWMLFALAAVVLLIAAANLANLLLSRAGARRREMAVRLALGAAQAALARSALAESAALAVGGVLVGVAIAAAGTPALAAALQAGAQTPWFEFSLDWRFLALLAAWATAICLLAGLAPALAAAKTAPAEALRSGGRSLAGGSGLRRGLVVAQVALAAALLAAGLLFAGSLHRLAAVQPGFREDHVLVLDADLSPLHLAPEARLAYQQRLLSRLQRIPAVRAATMVRVMPVAGIGVDGVIRIAPSAGHAGVTRATPWFNQISPGFFQTFGAKLLAGRNFLDSDTTASPPVAIVTQAFARQYLGGASPIGRWFQIENMAGKPGPAYRIVGLAADEKYEALRAPFVPIVFLDAFQNRHLDPDFEAAVYSTMDLATLEHEVVTAVDGVAPQLTVQFTPFRQKIEGGLRSSLLLAWLGAAFAVLALLLAAIGIYGVLAYRVTLRRREIGVRMAMGATRRQAAGVVVGTGIALGLVLAFAGARAVRGLLFWITPADPWVLCAVAVGLAMIGGAAAWVPARRAARLPPMEALRED